jgi:hypothetical protein
MAGGRVSKSLGAVGVAVLIAIFQGCGGSETPAATSGAQTAASSAAAGSTVSETEIQRYSAGTPQHTALEWWRAVQVNDPQLARDLYAEPPTLPNLAGQFNFVAGQLAGTAKVVSVQPKGKKAVVAIAWHKPGAPPHQVTVGMERKGGQWKIAETLFLDLMVQQMQRSGSAGGAATQGG